jgi:AcrR family transcriptional regulator
MYVSRRRSVSSTRQRIVTAVQELLEEGVFHETTVEQVAARAGVSRATLYQHFGTRLGLVDAMCERFDANPALIALRATEAVNDFVARVVDFWAAEETVLAQLYGAAAVDPAARDLVERQRRDRYGELRRLVRLLGAEESGALPALAVLTSFETFQELRRGAGLSQRRVVETLQEAATRMLTTPS